MEAEKRMLCAIARGEKKAPLGLKNASVADVFAREVKTADVALYNGFIAGVGNYAGEEEEDLTGKVLCPGFIDAHMHLESLMVLPKEAARALAFWGTTTVVADPHEIVNVCGAAGMRFLLEQTEGLPLDFYFMLPSSVPSTPFETNGAGFTVQDMLPFFQEKRVLGLGEVMCFDDVIAGQPGILGKIEAANGRVCDGHAPCLTGKRLQAYAAAGIDTEHECTTWEEAKEKLSAGLKILIREGSAAKNVEAIVHGIVTENMPSDRFMFCTDDKHIDDIMREGHIRWNVKKAAEAGMKPIEAISMATLNAAQCYGLPRLGAVAPGYHADLVVLDNLREFHVLSVYKNGVKVTESCFAGENKPISPALLRTVHLPALAENSFRLPVKAENFVIELVPGQIMTKKVRMPLPQKNGCFVAENGLNKLCVIERHKASGHIAAAPLKGYGIANGAVATTVAHDSHNLIAAGDNDRDILLAAKRAEEIGGGYVLVSNGLVKGELPLPVAGLISTQPAKTVVEKAQKMIAEAHEMGVCAGVDPFTTLSFLALPVIPELRLTDKGLFDVNRFAFLT